MNLLLTDPEIMTHLHILFSIPNIRFLRMATSSSWRFSLNCFAMRGSHPNNLIMRMTFIARRFTTRVRFCVENDGGNSRGFQQGLLSVTDCTRASVYTCTVENPCVAPTTGKNTYSLHLLPLRSLDVLGDPSWDGQSDQHGCQTDQGTIRNVNSTQCRPIRGRLQKDARTSTPEAGTGKPCRA